MAKNGRPAAAPENTAEQFEETTLGFCARHGLLMPKDRVIAAVSGGADSMALLVFLLRRAKTLGVRVEAVHVDHGIRGRRSAGDAAFVARFCAGHGVPLHVFSAAKAGIPVPEKPSEDWARRLRYGFFEQLLAEAAAGTGRGDAGQSPAQNGPAAAHEAKTNPGPVPNGRSGAGETAVPNAGAEPRAPRVLIATAHTLNDQAETLLFRLARGTGLQGAGGIRPAGGAFIRPLLAVDRAGTEGYCAALGIPFVQDETNADLRFARNRLRAEALPALIFANEGALCHLGAFCGQMQRLDGYFAAKGETLLQTAQTPGGWRLDVLQSALGQDEPVLEAALLRLLEAAAGAAPDARRLELAKELVARGRGALQLNGGLALAAGQGRLRLCAARNVSGGRPCPAGGRPGPAVLPPPPAPAPPAPFAPGVYSLPGGYAFSARVERVPRGENFIKLCSVQKKDLNSCADYGKIQGNVLLRTRQPGDTFRPVRRGVTKPLKKLCQELGLGPDERALRPLLARGSQVLWFWGQGFAEGLAPGPDTQDVLIITPIIGEKEVPKWE